MPDNQQKQTEILATKLMGWEKVEIFLKAAPVNQWKKDGKRVAGYDWNPFTNPADCEMLKVKLRELGYGYSINMCCVRESGVSIFRENEWDGYDLLGREYGTAGMMSVTMHGTSDCSIEYEAVCLAALQLPECKE